MARSKRLWVVVVGLIILASLSGCKQNQTPILSFVYSPDNPSIGEEITFNASKSYDPDGEIVSWDWSFGDGNTRSGNSVQHLYTMPGNYSVNLSVQDNDGAFSVKTQEITIKETANEITTINTVNIVQDIIR